MYQLIFVTYIEKDNKNNYQYLHGYTFLYLFLFLFSIFFASLHFKRSPVGRFWIQETIIKENLFVTLRTIYIYHDDEGNMEIYSPKKNNIPQKLCPKEIGFLWGNKSSYIQNIQAIHFFIILNDIWSNKIGRFLIVFRLFKSNTVVIYLCTMFLSLFTFLISKHGHLSWVLSYKMN